MKHKLATLLQYILYIARTSPICFVLYAIKSCLHGYWGRNISNLACIWINNFLRETDFPSFNAGDTITVHYKISEGGKERVQQFRGVVIQRRGSGLTETFTVRKLSGNIGVERIFPISSPFIDKIDINKHGQVRRARIFYLRGLTGKKARIQEKRMTASAGKGN